MIHDVFAFYDTKAALFSIPFFATNRAVAVRIAAEVAGSPDTTIGRHPNDYILFRIGSYDDNTGVLVSETSENLGVCASFLVAARPSGLFGEEPSNN